MDLLLLVGLVLAAAYAWLMGANDMANVVAAFIGSGTLRYRAASLIFAISVIAGSLLQGYMVMKTLGYGIVKDLDVVGAVIASISAVIWVAVATTLGLPVSTSQSITSGVIGVGIAYILKTREWGLVNFSTVYKIIASWVASPLLTIPFTTLLYLALEAIVKREPMSEKAVKGVAASLVGFSGYCFG
ncbi:MAG: inorganic phosphate transporter [Desulfurococcaceae archaeon]